MLEEAPEKCTSLMNIGHGYVVRRFKERDGAEIESGVRLRMGSDRAGLRWGWPQMGLGSDVAGLGLGGLGWGWLEWGRLGWGLA